MNNAGPIIVVEDDPDDLLILNKVFEELEVSNKVMYFEDGLVAYKFLVEFDAKPFLVLSDINMPKINGFELRDKIHNNEKLRLKCVPYVL